LRRRRFWLFVQRGTAAALPGGGAYLLQLRSIAATATVPVGVRTMRTPPLICQGDNYYYYFFLKPTSTKPQAEKLG